MNTKKVIGLIVFSMLSSNLSFAAGVLEKSEPKGIQQKEYYKDSKSRINDDVNDSIGFKKWCGFEMVKIDLDYKLIEQTHKTNMDGYLLCRQLPFSILLLCKDNKEYISALKSNVQSGLCLLNPDPDKITAELKNGLLTVSYGTNVTSGQISDYIMEYLKNFNYPEEKAKDDGKKVKK